MKYIIYIIVLLTFPSIYAQEKINISGCLKISRTENAQWIQRDQNDIHQFQAEDAKSKDLSCDVLFIGSSSFRLWKTISDDMAPLKIINRGYGGSTIRDIIFYYDIIVKPYSPKKIVLYVENDFAGWGSDLLIGDAYDFFRLFAQKVHDDFPAVHLYIVSIKPSPSREKLFPKIAIFNALIKEYCATNDKTIFVDVASHMFDENGKLKETIFTSDNLHLNEKGYQLWTSVIKPYLMQ